MREAPLSVRAATPEDAAAIAAVHVRTWQVAYRGQLPDELLDGLRVEPRERWWRVEWWKQARARHRLLVADTGDGIVGFAAVGPSRDDGALADGRDAVETSGDGPETSGDAEGTTETIGELYAIYVDPVAWGTGVGRHLMERAARELRSAEFREATLWVIETNARARRFYEIAGWTADGGRKTEQIGSSEVTEVRYRRLL